MGNQQITVPQTINTSTANTANVFEGNVVLDAATANFLTATGITSPVIIYALNFLVTSLKGTNKQFNPAGIDYWTGSKAIYPFVGGTATTHKFNLKNPLNTDAAFRLDLSGGRTHSSTGARTNGTNCIGNTLLNPSLHTTANNIMFGSYFRINQPIGAQMYGCTDATTNYYHFLNAASFALSATINYTGDPTQKFMMARRTSATFMEAYRNGVSLGTTTSGPATAPPNASFYLGAWNNNGSVERFLNNEYAFTIISDGTTDAGAKALTAIVNQFQTILGRAV